MAIEILFPALDVRVSTNFKKIAIEQQACSEDSWAEDLGAHIARFTSREAGFWTYRLSADHVGMSSWTLEEISEAADVVGVAPFLLFLPWPGPTWIPLLNEMPIRVITAEAPQIRIGPDGQPDDAAQWPASLGPRIEGLIAQVEVHQ